MPHVGMTSRPPRRSVPPALALALATAVMALVAPRGSAQEPVTLARYMADRVARTHFSGTVLVSRGDTILLDAAYGRADYDLGTPNAVGTLFRIGSLTKPITAVAALRLADRRMLDLDTPACDRIAHCPEEWRAITVRQLLGHRSGLPGLFSRHSASPVEAAAEGFERVLSDLVVERARGDSSARLRFRPGTQYEYNNFNYVFLAYLMEKATASYWEDVLRQYVFEPARMSATRYDRVYEIVPGRARGYRVRDGRIENTDYDDHEAYAAGGLLSTADDLRRFVRAAVSGGLLSDSMRAAMLEPGLGDYGLGWQIVDSYSRTLYNHTGSIQGFSSYVGFYPRDGLLVVVLSNVQDEPARGTGCDLAGLALDRPISRLDRHLAAVPLRADEIDAGAFGRYVGLADGDGREIRPSGDGGVTYARGSSVHALLAVGADSFTVAESRESLFRLVRDPAGAVAGLRIERCGGVVTDARKEPPVSGPG